MSSGSGAGGGKKLLQGGAKAVGLGVDGESLSKDLTQSPSKLGLGSVTKSWGFRVTRLLAGWKADGMGVRPP